MKRILLVLFLASCCSHMIHGQTLSIVIDDEKIGFKNENGDTIVVPVYDEVNAMSSGYWEVGKQLADDEEADSWWGFEEEYFWGVLDSLGKEIIPVDFDKISDVNHNRIRVSKGDSCGYFDSQGNAVIPLIHGYCSEFYEHLAFFRPKGQRGSIIRDDGTKVESNVSPDYLQSYFDDATGYWWFRHRFTGYNVLGPYEMASSFKNGVALVSYGDSSFVIDHTGKTTYGFKKGKFEEASLQANGLIKIKKQGLEGCIDKYGEWKIPLADKRLFEFLGDIAAFEKDGKQGFINEEGEILVQAKFDSAIIVNEGILQLSKNGLWGSVNTKGKWITKPRYEQPLFYNENGLAIGIQDEQLYLVSLKKGNLLEINDVDQMSADCFMDQLDTCRISNNEFITFSGWDGIGVVDALSHEVIYPLADEISYIGISELIDSLTTTYPKIDTVKYAMFLPFIQVDLVKKAVKNVEELDGQIFMKGLELRHLEESDLAEDWNNNDDSGWGDDWGEEEEQEDKYSDMRKGILNDIEALEKDLHVTALVTEQMIVNASKGKRPSIQHEHYISLCNMYYALEEYDKLFDTWKLRISAAEKVFSPGDKRMLEEYKAAAEQLQYHPYLHEEIIKEELGLIKKIYGAYGLEAMIQYTLLGLNFFEQGKYDQAETALKKAYRNYTIGASDHEIFLDYQDLMLLYLTWIYDRKGEYDQANKYAREYKAFYDEYIESYELADEDMAFGDDFDDEFGDDEEFYDLAESDAEFSGERVDNVSNMELENIWTAYKKRQDLMGSAKELSFVFEHQLSMKYEEHLEYEQSLVFARSVLKQEFHNMISVSTKNRKGKLHALLGDYQKARDEYAKAQEDLGYLTGNDKSFVLSMNRGNLYVKEGKYDSAKLAYQVPDEQGLTVREQAIRWNNLGNLENIRGDINYAQTYYQFSNELFETVEDSTTVRSDVWNNLGIILSKQGMMDSAVFFYERSIGLKERLLREGHPDILESYNNLAIAYRKQGQYDSAIVYYEKSLVGKKVLFGEWHPDLLQLKMNIALVYGHAEQYEKAHELMNQLNNEAQRYYKTPHPNLARIHNIIAETHLKSGSIEKSLATLEKSIKANSNETGLIMDDRVYMKTATLQLQGLYDLFLQDPSVQKTKQILDVVGQLDSLGGSIRQNMNSMDAKFDLSDMLRTAYDIGLNSCYEGWQMSKADDFLANAHHLLERSKIGTVRDITNDLNAKSIGGVKKEELDYEKELSASIAKKKQRLLLENDLSSEFAMRVKSALLQEQQQLAQHIQKLEQEYPEYHRLKYSTSTLALDEVQKKMDDQEVVLSYLVGNDWTNALVITIDTAYLSRKSSKNVDLKKTKALRTLIQYQMTSSFDETSIEIGRDLISCLKPVISTKSNLVVYPDAHLYHLPFDALYLEETANDRKYLIDYFNTSEGSCATYYYNATESTTPQRLLAFAPVFNPGNNVLSGEKRSISGVIQNGEITYLPGTEREVKNISGTYKKQVNDYLFEKANEKNFKAEKLSEYDIIHFATHGFVNNQAPKFSGILLSPNQDAEDDILFAHEVAGLNLDVDLVCLSACETGLGEIQSGEGVLGLSRSFITAGADNVIVSLWQVSDEGTQALMSQFYANISMGKSFPEALSEAKRHLIRTPKYSDPYIWSAFKLVSE